MRPRPKPSESRTRWDRVPRRNRLLHERLGSSARASRFLLGGSGCRPASSPERRLPASCARPASPAYTVTAHYDACLGIRFFVGCALIIPMIIQTILLYPSGAVWTDEAPNVSRPDPSGTVQIDAEHPSRNRKVEGSNPSSGSPRAPAFSRFVMIRPIQSTRRGSGAHCFCAGQGPPGRRQRSGHIAHNERTPGPWPDW
jgi:hypothetical protein